MRDISVNYFFEFINLFFVVCEQEPVMPVICVFSKHLYHSVGFALTSIVPVREVQPQNVQFIFVTSLGIVGAVVREVQL